MQDSRFFRASKLTSLVLCSFLFLLGCQPKVSGTYSGTCYNLTYGKQGILTLILTQDGERVLGSLTISGDLSGGGALEGRVDGENISFTTSDALIGRLAWTGRVIGSRIEGTYLVQTNPLTTLLAGTKNQQGTWTATRH